MSDYISPAEKLRNNSHDLDDASFEVDMSGTTISSFTYSYGSIEDLELDEDYYVATVDGEPLDNFVIINKDTFDEVMQDLEDGSSVKGVLFTIRDFIDRMIRDHGYD